MSESSTTTAAKPTASVQQAPVKPGGAPKPVVAASNQFGMMLYRELSGADAGGNLAFSPAGISLALAMTYAGAKGKTADEMRTAMYFPAGDALHGGWASVIDGWQNTNAANISVANRLFGDKKYTFETPYLELTKARYGAPLESVDFAGAPEKQRKHINDWVAQHTHDLIKDLVPLGGVSGYTRMALVNALYFKAKWTTPFNKDLTEEANFKAPGGNVKVQMMSQTGYMRYGEADGAILAERSYDDSAAFATLFVLPEDPAGLSALEKKLDRELLERWTDALTGERVGMQLPRFKVKSGVPFELSAVLSKMGIKTAFERMQADFTRIAKPPRPADRLFIEKVFHKAFVAVDEAGTEAAAATAVTMARAGGMPAEPKQFVADRPFLFFVRDANTGLVLFAGRVTDPSKD